MKRKLFPHWGNTRGDKPYTWQWFKERLLLAMIAMAAAGLLILIDYLIKNL